MSNSDYKKSVNAAHDDLWEMMASPEFVFSDFDDIVQSYGIDADDLLERLI